ncbi:TrbC/VirB2 family protein [Paucibacter sp. O1-1]|nr:TrbC/VirB2 family protein [Paucibacter sp. O1-1]MDA3831247.1 TrbC/VirB2 family protein [Paucibacter sp. O1-1]
MSDTTHVRGDTPSAAAPLPIGRRARSLPAGCPPAPSAQTRSPAPRGGHRHHHWLDHRPRAFPNLRASRRMRALAAAVATPLVTEPALAQGFEKINTTVTNVNLILVTISVAVVTIAIIWAGFKMIFQGARLADVANVLIGGTLVGGAAAFATFIVS